MRTRGSVAAMAITVVAVVAAGALAPAGSPAGAAGVTTHAWMAEVAVGLVEDPDLRALLEAHPAQVRAGAMFPDGGYVPGHTHGEEAHWARFTDAYVARIQARTDCGDIADPAGPCAPQIAHLMGVRAHGTGDEVWDWLFEPHSPDLDEYYLPPSLAPFQDGGGQELTMDLAAIGHYGRPVGPLPPLPSTADLLAAFEAAGLGGVTEQMLLDGQTALGIISEVEAGWVPEHLAGVRASMPWMTHNLVTAPGGVAYAATAIAGQWASLWGELTGERPPTEVAVTHPADGQRRVPATGWVRSYQAGSHPDRGGARTRIAATLTHGLPYVPATGGAPVPAELPEGSMRLVRVATDDEVAPMAGFPRNVPYRPDPGQYTIAFQPAADLEPCEWYRVEVTSTLRDARDEPVVPTSWEFRTGSDGDGRRCADDPDTPDERYLRAAYHDLLGRDAEAAGLEAWTWRFERGLTPARFAADAVATEEHRTRLVRQAYLDLLGRPADPGGLAHWTAHVRTRTLADLRARLLASPELHRAAGGTDEQWVRRAYQVVLGRAPDAGGLSFWTGELDRGRSRLSVSRALLATPEVTTRQVEAVYVALLGRSADPGGRAHWVPRVARSDERVLLAAVVGSPEYVGRAQVR